MQLVDGYGRVATDLRISVTDRCNFRCRYCMPPEGLPWLPREAVLSFDEIDRVVGTLMTLGISSLKLTGGEPLVRQDLPLLVRKLRDRGPELDISMTTNGYLLADSAAALAGAGLDRVTVSCDSLLRHRFAEITLRDALQRVMEGLVVAADCGLTPIKVNTVVMRGVNEDEVVDFAALARATGYEVRFIEYMPLDAQDRWSIDGVVPASEVIGAIEAAFPLELSDTTTTDASRTYRFADGAQGSVGVIASVSEPFCDSCDRLRLTADGQLRSCLFSLDETDLRGPLRSGATDDDLAQLAVDCVAHKPEGHKIGRAEFVRPQRSMSQIGG